MSTRGFWRSGTTFLPQLLAQDPELAAPEPLHLVFPTCSLSSSIFRGILLDMAPTGIRIETDVELPPGSIITMTVIQIGDGVTRYHLTGEARWARPSGNVTHLGVAIYEIEDNERWQEFYFVMSSNF